MFQINAVVVLLSLLACGRLPAAHGFNTMQKSIGFHPRTYTSSNLLQRISRSREEYSSSSALGIWWFGGSEMGDASGPDDDSCELVAVRIERTSANSRRIMGEITVPTPIQDVWAILTDYDRLSTHVPNLMESKIERRLSGGEQGDGSFRCTLFQRGSQKIVGFEFGASVTMEMTEQIMPAQGIDGSAEERRIKFKCVDSFFFSEFDGEWLAKERINPETSTPETVLYYVVDVRPKGPVPVAALEWRIREDVPTNLRAVKKASSQVGERGIIRLNGASTSIIQQRSVDNGSAGIPNDLSARARLRAKKTLVPVSTIWDADETMAAYLRE